MPGPGALFFAQVQSEFYKAKTSGKHEAFKFVLDGIKGIMGAKSAAEAAVKLTAEGVKTVAGAAMSVGSFGVDAIVNFATGKVVDKGADAFIQFLEGEGVVLDGGKIEYKYERKIGDAFAKVIQHAGMLQDALEAYDDTHKGLVKAVGKGDPQDMYKHLKALVYSFNALIWVWNKLHRDAAAIIGAAKDLETFAKDSGKLMQDEQKKLLVLLDGALKDNPAMALLGKKK